MQMSRASNKEIYYGKMKILYQKFNYVLHEILKMMCSSFNRNGS
jgi:hypothetical protein